MFYVEIGIVRIKHICVINWPKSETYYLGFSFSGPNSKWVFIFKGGNYSEKDLYPKSFRVLLSHGGRLLSKSAVDALYGIINVNINKSKVKTTIETKRSVPVECCEKLALKRCHDPLLHYCIAVLISASENKSYLVGFFQNRWLIVVDSR